MGGWYEQRFIPKISPAGGNFELAIAVAVVVFGINSDAAVGGLTRGHRWRIISIDKLDKVPLVLVSQKSQYGLRAILELARHHGRGWVKVSRIAGNQAIPPRFLEVILNQLKQGRFVVSKRGSEGGYALVRPPQALAVGEVLRFMQGPIGPVACIAGKTKDQCPEEGPCAFHSLWERVNRAMADVYDQTTFQDLLDGQERDAEQYVGSYSI